MSTATATLPVEADLDLSIAAMPGVDELDLDLTAMPIGDGPERSRIFASDTHTCTTKSCCTSGACH